MKPEENNLKSMNPINKPRRNQRALKIILLILLVALLLAAGCYVIYKWQNNQLVTSQAQLTQANKSIASQKNTLDQLTAQVATLKTESKQATDALASYESQVNSVTPSDLAITVNGAQYVNPAGTVTASGSWFGINVTVNNPTKSSITLALNTLQLKDKANNSYPEFGFSGSTTLPSGWVDLASQTLAPGDTVKGVVLFQMPNTSTKSFTFINGSKSYVITSTN